MCSRTSSTIHCSWWFLYWQLPFKCCVSNLVDSHWRQFHWLKENTWFVFDWDLCQSLLASSLNFSFLPVFSISLLHQLNLQMKNMMNDRLIFIHELYLAISKFIIESFIFVQYLKSPLILSYHYLYLQKSKNKDGQYSS